MPSGERFTSTPASFPVDACALQSVPSTDGSLLSLPTVESVIGGIVTFQETRTRDTLHHHSYRLFCTLPERTSNPLGFYRLQYGINFRRWDGQSYSAKDPVRSRTTRNLGTIMEAATDRFAQEWVFFLAEGMGYRPAKNTVEDYLYKDCTGQLTEPDIVVLRDIEQGRSGEDLPEPYLKSMRLFAQYVTMRYRAFLAPYELARREDLQNHMLMGMFSGKFRALCHLLDNLQGSPQSFVTLFKTVAYSAQKST